jgi:protein-disulfide isomerase
MSASSPGELVPVGEHDHVLGAAEPELTLVEYGDFGCPFCFAASRPIASLLERFPTLRLVWRHFPDSELHPGADLAAELSELAAAHGKFWEAHALLLAGRESFSAEELLAVARRLDLDPGDAEEAMGGRRYRERVRGDVAGGEQAGVHATPTFFVDGEPLVGSWSRLAQVVPAALTQRPGA